jgi:Ni/Co efflux regulator RcnB
VTIEALLKELDMNAKLIIGAVLAATIAATGAASAQDRHDNDRRGPDREHRDDHRDDRRDDRRMDYSQDRRNDRADYRHDDRRGSDHRGAGPRHDMYKGGRLPSEYRGRQYVVDNWRDHHLSAPPRGYHWVQTGSDYVLVGIATGVIASLLLSN